jgi:hypothetical protein
MNEGRPRELTKGKIDYIIASIQNDPKCSIRKIRKNLRGFLIERLKENHPELTEKEVAEEVDHGEDDGFREYHLLSESSIDKYERINKIREKIIQRNKQPEILDQPWSIGSLINFPIHDRTSLAVVSEFADRIRKGGKSELLIRDALWIARLCVIPLENQARDNIEEDYHQRLLYEVAFCYSFMERLMEIEKYGRMDTSLFDGDTLERTGRNFIEFYKKYPKLPQFEELQDLLKEGEANG